VNNGKNGKVFLLENVRFYLAEEGSRVKPDGTKEKETKENIEKFRKSLSQLGDIYVNDAFGTAHRAHSSVSGITLPTRAAGLLMKKEIEYFSKILENPQKPYLVIVGGAKVKDKIPLMKNLLDRVDRMIITGGMTYTFLKDVYGMKIGKSLYDKASIDLVKEIVNKAKEKNVELIFPEDFVITKEIKDDANTSIVSLSQGVPDDQMAIDVGPKTIEKFDKAIVSSRTIFLNGANGVFESAIGRNGSIKLVEVKLIIY
jgi:phosphoglycerate kinase